MKEYTTDDFKQYILIGRAIDGRRFRDTYTSYLIASNVNMYRGRMWGVKHDGKRVLLKKVQN